MLSFWGSLLGNVVAKSERGFLYLEGVSSLHASMIYTIFLVGRKAFQCALALPTASVHSGTLSLLPLHSGLASVL